MIIKNRNLIPLFTLCLFAIGITVGVYRYEGLAVFFGIVIAGDVIAEALARPRKYEVVK